MFKILRSDFKIEFNYKLLKCSNVLLIEFSYIKKKDFWQTF